MKKKIFTAVLATGMAAASFMASFISATIIIGIAQDTPH